MTKTERKKEAEELGKLISKEIHRALGRPENIFDKDLEKDILPVLLSNDEGDVLEGFKGGIPWYVIGKIEDRWGVVISSHEKANASRPIARQLHDYYKKVSHDHVILYRTCVADIAPTCAGKEISKYIDSFSVRFHKVSKRYEISTLCKDCIRERQKVKQRKYRLKNKRS